MAFQADSSQLAGRARRLYTDELVKGLTALVRRVVEIAHAAQDKPADHHTRQRRRDLAQALRKSGKAWLQGMANGLQQVLTQGATVSATA